MVKLKRCPRCDEPHLADEWQRGRKLRQRCYECDWVGEPRTPEKQRIQQTRTISVGPFSGFHYEIFDQYGHAMVSSRYYGKRETAVKELRADLESHSKMPNAGPCKGVLWPATVKVKGELFK